MDNDLLIETLKELFSKGRIDISFREFSTWGSKGLRLTIKLDKEKVYEEDIVQEYAED